MTCTGLSRRMHGTERVRRTSQRHWLCWGTRIHAIEEGQGERVVLASDTKPTTALPAPDGSGCDRLA